ncbi:MAG: hypothetical protein SGI77_26650 [Pirellulaceae bacterium]|nr:hypothetical protein [Pirellulaceae bacterium]
MCSSDRIVQFNDKQHRMLTRLPELRALSGVLRRCARDNNRQFRWAIAFLSVFVSGCGQILIRHDSNYRHDLGCEDIDVSTEPACEIDRLGLIKSNLSWQGERISSGATQCSDKVSEYWYSSRLGQWVVAKRDAKNAPPYPKFHPIPTHPALYPDP